MLVGTVRLKNWFRVQIGKVFVWIVLVSRCGVRVLVRSRSGSGSGSG